jgi:hypothetical protein
MTRLSGAALEGGSRPERVSPVSLDSGMRDPEGAGTGPRNPGVGRAQVGQWYARRDKGEIFQVIGADEESRTVEIQTFDGDLDEIDADAWAALPLALAAQPEDWTGPVDDVERDDLGYSETEMTGADWSEPLQQLRTEPEEPEDEEAPVEALVLERPMVPQRL